MKNKSLKALLTIFFLSNYANASLFWDVNVGASQLRKNNNNFAFEYLQGYVNNNPNDEYGYYWLAKAYKKKKNNKLALENFKKSYEIALKEKNIEKINFSIQNSQNIEDYFDLASLYVEAGDLVKAEKYADMMLLMNSKSSSAYFIKAKLAYLQSDINLATDYLTKAVVLDEKLLETNLAHKLNIKENIQITLKMYEILALESYFQGDIDNAIKYIKKYIAQDGSNLDIQNLLCELYIQNLDFISAQRVLDEIFKVNENNVQAILNQAKIYKLNKNEKFIEMLECAYEINPNNSKILLELGNYYLAKQDYINSIKYFEILTNINDSLYEGYFGYIYSLINLGKVDGIMNLIRKAIMLNPSASEINFLLAKLCEVQGETIEASEYLNEAIKKEDNANYYLELAKVNYQLKKYEQSLLNLREIQNSEHIANKDELDEYYIKNYLKLNNDVHVQNNVNHLLNLDKNRLLYKYYLYKSYKKQSYNSQMQIEVIDIEKIKPKTVDDFIDLSDILLEEKGIESAIKILNNGIKKFPKESKLYMQKIMLYSSEQNKTEIKKVLNAMQKTF